MFFSFSRVNDNGLLGHMGGKGLTLKKLSNIFQTDQAILDFHHQCLKVTFAPHLHQPLILFFFYSSHFNRCIVVSH